MDFHVTFILGGHNGYNFDPLSMTMIHRFDRGNRYFVSLNQDWNPGIRNVLSRLINLE